MPSISSDVSLHVPLLHKQAYTLYPQRFYVLFTFSFLAFNQCIIWLTFSPIDRVSKTFFGITDDVVTLLLNWGPIIFIPCLPLTYVLLNKPHGLRKCVMILAIVDFLGAACRVLPLIIKTTDDPKFGSIAVPFLHAGQILNAACGPLVMAPVSQLSCVWFAPHERTRATTIAIFANNFGATIGFMITPLICPQPEDVPRILYIHLGLAFVACILALSYFPAQPPTAPSAAAELIAHNPENPSTNHTWRTLLKDVRTCLTNPAFVLLSTAGGLLYGTFGAWTGVYDIILKPEGYSEEDAGWFGFGSSLAGILGGLVLSYFADKPRFQHSLKSLIMISFIACLLSIIWFELSVRSIFYDKRILPSTVVTIGLSTGLAGLFSGAASPLIYEAVAEIMFPLPESLSASILVQWINVVTLIFLFVAPSHEKLVNFLVLIVMIISIIMVLFTRFTYKRRDEDEQKRKEKEETLMANGK